MGMLSLPKEPNERLCQIIGRSAVATALVPYASAAGLAIAGQGMAAGAVAMGGLVVTWIMAGTPLLNGCVNDPTPRIPKEMRHSPRRIAKLLMTASRQGMTPMDRLVAQRELETTVEALSILCGKEPWIAAAQNCVAVSGLDDHLKVRADRLIEAEYMFSLVEKRSGSSIKRLRYVTAWFVPLLASVAADFGLDATGLVPTSARVSGQILDKPTPIPLLSESLHRLATEWRDGANDLVDPLIRIEADAAAGRDLRALENAWAVARADASPELVDQVDERFTKAAASLSATLAEAIAMRGRTQMDALEIEARYIESKHAG